MINVDVNTQVVMEDMRAYMGRAKDIESTGGLVKTYEVEMDCLVQFIEFMPAQPGQRPSWRFHQYQVSKMDANIRDAIMGLYLNDQGRFIKIIGIYKVLVDL